MRIGILCHPTYGGSGVVASELALTLAEHGHTVHLFSHDVPPRLARSPGPVEVHVAQGSPYPLFHSTPHDLAIMSSILDLHRLEPLDVLHAHYAVPHAISALVVRSAAEDAGLPKLRVALTLHGTDITLVGNDPSYAPLTQYAITGADAVTAVSKDLAERTSANFEGRPPCGITVIPNFVDIEEFSPDAEPCKSKPDIATAIHVSNFRSVKRVPWLVHAFADALETMRASDKIADLVLVGDGPEHGEARRVARDRGVHERVRFLGMRDALPGLLGPADVFCLASREESFGLSALEAMACGTPVVGTRAGGLPEVVEDGVSGHLVEIDDRAGYARALASLLSDRSAARAMGDRAREETVKRFDRANVVREYESMYRGLIDERTPCP